MSVGIVVQKADLDFAVGKMSADINDGYERAISYKAWLDTNYPTALPDPLMAAFGYTTAEAVTIRNAINDAAYQATNAYGSSAPLKAVRGL